jgi:cbb3-type cytochrome oxidase cytochrome c subunit
MPSYTWLAEREVDGDLVTAKLEVLQLLGDPYTDEQWVLTGGIAGNREWISTTFAAS